MTTLNIQNYIRAVDPSKELANEILFQLAQKSNMLLHPLERSIKIVLTNAERYDPVEVVRGAHFTPGDAYPHFNIRSRNAGISEMHVYFAYTPRGEPIYLDITVY